MIWITVEKSRNCYTLMLKKTLINLFIDNIYFLKQILYIFNIKSEREIHMHRMMKKMIRIPLQNCMQKLIEL